MKQRPKFGYDFPDLFECFSLQEPIEQSNVSVRWLEVQSFTVFSFFPLFVFRLGCLDMAEGGKDLVQSLEEELPVPFGVFIATKLTL